MLSDKKANDKKANDKKANDKKLTFKKKRRQTVSDCIRLYQTV
jgi:hypothetical protein